MCVHTRKTGILYGVCMFCFIIVCVYMCFHVGVCCVRICLSGCCIVIDDLCVVNCVCTFNVCICAHNMFNVHSDGLFSVCVYMYVVQCVCECMGIV